MWLTRVSVAECTISSLFQADNGRWPRLLVRCRGAPREIRLANIHLMQGPAMLAVTSMHLSIYRPALTGVLAGETAAHRPPGHLRPGSALADVVHRPPLVPVIKRSPSALRSGCYRDCLSLRRGRGRLNSATPRVPCAYGKAAPRRKRMITEGEILSKDNWRSLLLRQKYHLTQLGSDLTPRSSV